MALVNDEGSTIRFPATSLLTIDSEDRFKTAVEKRDVEKGSSPYDFTVSPGNGGRTIIGGFIRRMGVSELQFPWCIPNVNRQTNSINVTWNGATTGGSATVTITQGFYTPSELAIKFQTAVRAISPADLGAFTITYSSVSNDPIFYYNTNNTTTILFTPLPPIDNINVTQQSKQLFDLLGFSSQQYIAATSGNGLATFCQFTRYIDIVSPNLTAYQGLFDGSTQLLYYDSLCRVYLGNNDAMLNQSPSDPDYSPPGCRPYIIYRQFQNMKMINWNGRNNIGSTLQFKVYNDCGQILSVNTPFLGNSSYEDWSMTILASEN